MLVQLTERHIQKPIKELEDACFKAAKLYNFCNYYKRQVYFGTVQKFKEYELSTLLCKHDEYNFRQLPSSVSQQVIRSVFKDWNMFFKTKSKFQKNKINVKPPKYKKKLSHLVFTKSSFKVKNNIIKFTKAINLPSIKTKASNVDMVRIIPKTNCFIIEVVYKKEVIKNENLDKSKFLSIDLGVNNIITSVNNAAIKAFIINGKIIKSKNQYCSKIISTKTANGKNFSSKKINSAIFNRNKFIEDKLHKISSAIVYICNKNNIGNIVIGYNKGWKNRIKSSSKNNQAFNQIPYYNLVQKIIYKSSLCGIKVILTEESYTSKIDHLAYEPMEKNESYLGRRIHRGLFQSSVGKLINADINGAIGIARKVFGDSVIQQIVNSGIAFNPIRLNIV